MARLGSLTPRQLVKLLKEHGFVEDHQSGSHLVLWQIATNRRVVVPIHAREIPRGTLMAILRHAGISVDK